MLNSYLKGLAVVAAACLAFVGGCRQDIWTANYVPNPAAAAISKNAKIKDPLQVRVVTPEQVREAVTVERKYLDEHNLIRADATLAEQMQIQEKLFQVFRVRDSRSSVVRLGECTITSEEPLTESLSRLERLGKKKDASFILVVLFPQQMSKIHPKNLSDDAWGGGGNWANMGEYAGAAQLFRRLTPEEQEEIKGSKR
jgi:hypothetical protein